MADALKVVSSNRALKQKSHEKNRVAEHLANVLADTYGLLLKTHAYHWNVEGPLSFSIHSLTQEQCKDMFGAADALAERVRAFDELVPSTTSSIAGRVCIDETQKPLTAVEMCAVLSKDHENLSHRFRDLVDLAAGRSDPVTQALAVKRRDYHERAAWMLRALTKG